MNRKTQIQAYAYVVIIVLMSNQCWSMPPSPFNTWGVHSSIVKQETKTAGVSRCTDNIEIEKICQQCAKKSGSKEAYPWCCDVTDGTGAYTWCQRFINYGHS